MPSSSLQEQAYLAIHRMIVHNDLSRGTVTSEMHLCEQLGMSRTPIRAAIQRLEQEGFLRVIPKHGILVMEQSATKVGELMDVLASVLLYTLTSLKQAHPASLHAYLESRRPSFQELLHRNEDPAREASDLLGQFEFQLLAGLVGMARNAELLHLFKHTAHRLYWHSNIRRWNPPHYKLTVILFQAFMNEIADADISVYAAIHPYIQQLKKTWA